MTARLPGDPQAGGRLRDRLARGKRVRDSRRADVTMVIEGASRSAGSPACARIGRVSAFPGGEVSLPPLEGTTQGASSSAHHADIGRLGQPIVLTVENGECAGSTAASSARPRRPYRGVENAQHRRARHRPQSEVASDRITEVKKRLGCHMALGDSAASYGGR
jgi:hypothetical protein